MKDGLGWKEQLAAGYTGSTDVYRAKRGNADIFGYDPVRVMTSLVIDEWHTDDYKIRNKLFGNSDVAIDCVNTDSYGLACIIDFGNLDEA